MMNFQVKTRFATEADTPALIELIRLKAEFDGAADSVTATDEALRRTLFSDNPLAHVLLAEVGEKIAGLATYHPHFSTFLSRPGIWLDDLYVRETFRSGGVGEALLRRLCGISIASGGARIDWTVSALNSRAIGFYERIGAKIFSQSRIGRLNEDAIRKLAKGESALVAQEKFKIDWNDPYADE